MVFILSITEYFKDMSTSAKKILKLFVDWMQMMMNGSNGLQGFSWVIACLKGRNETWVHYIISLKSDQAVSQKWSVLSSILHFKLVQCILALLADSL